MAQPRDAGGKFLPFAPPGESANVMQPMKEFTNALDNFVNGGATKAVLGAEELLGELSEDNG